MTIYFHLTNLRQGSNFSASTECLLAQLQQLVHKISEHDPDQCVLFRNLSAKKKKRKNLSAEKDQNKKSIS